MIQLKQEKDITRLCLDGEMTVKNAAGFRDNLLQSLKKSRFVEIDFEAVTAVDLSCLQLIFSARRFAVEEGKDIIIKDKSVPVLHEALTRSGFHFQENTGFNQSV